MSDEHQGPATDRHNEPVVDPTENVKALNAAGFERQDILRETKSEHVRELLALRSDFAEKLSVLEHALSAEKFTGVERVATLTENHRLELKSDGEKALTAALSAADKAVEKAVTGMKELIVNNYQIAEATTKALGDKVEDLKAQVSILVNQRIGAGEQRQEQRAVSSGMVALIGLGSALLFGIISAVVNLLSR